MNNFRKTCLLTLGFTLISILSFSVWQKSSAQTKPLTYSEINTALNTKLPNKTFKTKTELINWLIAQIKQRKVDKPLTKDREEDLRQTGATGELIETIRQNSPSLPVQTLQPTPLATPTKTPSNADKNFKNSLGMEFIKITAGTFMMGSPDEENSTGDEKQHRVTISRDFYIGKYEVTQGQWKIVMGSNPSKFSDCGDDCPVDKVSWNDVQTFIKKLNAKNEGTYRLPTEAEWEYAARAGTTTPFGIGDGQVLSSDEANYDARNPGEFSVKGTFLNKPVRVGSYKPNKWGLYDMHGNVAEWCSDWYESYNPKPRSDDTLSKLLVNLGKGRVIRGGSWISSADYIRSASRAKDSPDSYGLYGNYGFRLIRE